MLYDSLGQKTGVLQWWTRKCALDFDRKMKNRDGCDQGRMGGGEMTFQIVFADAEKSQSSLEEDVADRL